jgi:hypothetical protein
MAVWALLPEINVLNTDLKFRGSEKGVIVNRVTGQMLGKVLTAFDYTGRQRHFVIFNR